MKTQSSFHVFTRNVLTAAIAGVLLTPCIAQAANYTWDCSSDSYWDITTCWSPNGTPTSSDAIYVGSEYYTSTASSTLTIDLFTGSAYASSLSISNSGSYTTNLSQTGGSLSVGTGLYVDGGATNNTTYSLSGGSLSAGAEEIGVYGTGNFNQSGGTNTVNSGLYLGYYNTTGDSTNGTYTLSGTGNLSASDEYIGYGDIGTFNQTAGTNTVGNLDLGTQSTGNGSYDLSGGSLSASQSEVIGDSGTGSFTQSDGTNTVNGYLELGKASGSNGSYDLSAGSLSVSDSESIGNTGTGTFTQSGGTNTMAYSLLVGSYGGSGTYNQYDGSLSAGVEEIGVYGTGATGIFSQSGGTNTTNILYLGDSSGTSGTYNLSYAGNLTVSTSEYIGFSGDGTFNQTGGTNTMTGDLLLGETIDFYFSNSGTYNLSGGSLSASNEYIGGDPSNGYYGSVGTGTFTQSGGYNTVSGNLVLGYGGGSGTYNLQYGTLVVGGLENDSNSSYFNWTAGTLDYTNTLTIGSGNFFSSLYLGSGKTLDASSLTVAADGSINLNGGSNTVDNNMDIYGNYALSNGTLAVNGAMNNSGSLTLSGGTLSGSGVLSNNGGMSGYGTIAGSGGFINNGLFTQGTGAVTLSNTGTNANYANMDLAGGYQFALSVASFNNYGTVNMNGALVTGTGSLHNQVGGTVAGRGSITSGFSNAGTVAVSGGTLNISPAFTNSGVIDMTGATTTLAGGAVSNSGTIQGAGNFGNNIANTGTIDPVGGTLNLSGTVTNQAGGTIRSSAGTKVLAVNGMAPNAGLVSLAGGTVDTNGHALSNTGNITGYGVLSTGGLTNSGKMTLSGGTATVNGAVNNAASGTINVAYNPAVFTGPVVNNGMVKTTSATVTFAGGYTENGTYISDPSNNYFTDVTIGANGFWTGGTGDNFFISGNFINNSIQSTLWNTTAAGLTLDGSGSQDLYLAGADLGAVNAGYQDNFAWGDFSLAAGDSLNVLDGNSDPTAALYVGGFSLGGGLDQLSSINSDYNIYYNPNVAGNAYLGGQTYALNGSGYLMPAVVPLPPALWLFGSGLLGLVGIARRKVA